MDIHGVVKENNWAKIKSVLAQKPGLVNIKDNTGCTPLHHAVFWSDENVVELLLAKQAQVNIKDDSRRIHLHMAAIRAHKDVVELLITKSAQVNGRDNHMTVLLYIMRPKKGISILSNCSVSMEG